MIKTYFSFLSFCGLILGFLCSLFFLGCRYDAPPSPPAAQIDTWLVGVWQSQDHSGHHFQAKVLPKPGSDNRYLITLTEKNGEFEAWISRVGQLKILTLRSLCTDPRYHGKYLLFHYELIPPKPDPKTGISEQKIRLTELQLPKRARSLDSYYLRQMIRHQMEIGLLLLPEGSSVWERTQLVSFASSSK